MGLLIEPHTAVQVMDPDSGGNELFMITFTEGYVTVIWAILKLL